MKPDERARPAADAIEAHAAHLDHLINERQTGQAPHPHNAETALIDALVQVAAATEPTPQFVAQLEQQIQNRFSVQARERVHDRAQTREWRGTSPWAAFWPFRKSKLAFVMALVLLLFFSLLLTTPTVRATLWDWLYGVGLLNEAQVARQTIPLEAPTIQPDAASNMTLAEIQQQAPFPVHPPQTVPTGLRFTGGFVLTTENGTQVTLAYHTGAAPANGYPPDAPLLFVAISDSALPNRPLVAEGYQQPVPVGKQIGFYTQGNWRSETPPTAKDTEIDQLVWDNTLDVAWLVWQADGLHYLLYAQGLGFSAEEMVQVAGAME